MGVFFCMHETAYELRISDWSSDVCSSDLVNGAARLLLDDDRPRFARLERGEAMFHVVHKDADPFVVEAGSAQFVDLGTAFNVVRGAGRTAVAVSEGIVAYNPKGANIRMTAGQGLEARDGDREAPKVQRSEEHTS